MSGLLEELRVFCHREGTHLEEFLFKIPDDEKHIQFPRLFSTFDISLDGENISPDQDLVSCNGAFDRDRYKAILGVIEDIVIEKSKAIIIFECLRNLYYFNVLKLISDFLTKYQESNEELINASSSNCQLILTIDSDSGELRFEYRLSEFKYSVITSFMEDGFDFISRGGHALSLKGTFRVDASKKVDNFYSGEVWAEEPEDDEDKKFWSIELTEALISNHDCDIGDNPPADLRIIKSFVDSILKPVKNFASEDEQEVALRKSTDIPWFMVKFFGLNSVLFATYAAISTYAQVGVIAGLTAATGPIGIAIAASIFILSACALLYRRYCKNNARVPVANAPVGNAAPVESNDVPAPEANPEAVLVFQEAAQMQGSIQDESLTSEQVDSVLGAGLPD